MDAAPHPSALAVLAQTKHAGLPSPAPSRQADILAAWPRCAQFAATFVLGGVTALLGAQVLAALQSGSEPADLQEAQPITYRVDLNESRRAELLQLPGIGPALADRIEEYRKAHGRFQSVDELRKVPGIGPATMEKLRPLVMVKAVVAPPGDIAPPPAKSEPAAKPKIASQKGLIDINTASLAELQTLPGIGPKLSQRIVDERERKAFVTVDDLRRVAGIGPKTLEKVKPYATVGTK